MKLTAQITFRITKEEKELTDRITEIMRIPQVQIYRRGLKELQQDALGDMTQNNNA